MATDCKLRCQCRPIHLPLNHTALMAQNIVVNLEVDTAGAVTNIDAVEQAITETSDATKSLKAQLRELQVEMQDLDPSDARFEELAQQAGALKDQINETSEAIRNNAGNAFEGLSNNASTLGSRLLSLDFAGAGQSAKAMGSNIKNINLKTFTTEIGGAVKGFASLAKAILANPIFLIATAIIAIGAALKGVLDQQREDVDNANKAIDNSNAQRHEQERKRIAAAGSDEKKLAEIKKQSIADDISDTEKKINNLVRQERTAYGISEEQEQELAKLREQLSKQRIDQEVLALEQINKLNSQRASIEERLFESGLSARDRERRQIELRYQKEIEAIKAVGGTQEDVNKILQLQQIEANNLSNKFAAEDAQKRKQAAEERKRQAAEQKAAKEKEAEERAQLERDQNNGIKSMKSRSATMLENEYDTGIKMIDMQKRTQAAITENLALEEKKRQDIRERNLQFAKDNMVNGLEFLSNITTIFEGKSKKQQEKAFKIRKGISIAQTLISTYQGAMQAYNSQIIPLDPSSVVRGAVAAAFVVAAGLANVKKISAQKFDGGGGAPSTGGGGGGGGGLGGGGGGSQGGTPTFNPIDTSFLGNRPAQTPQAYVLAGHVSSAQDANAKVKDLRRL